MSTLTQIAAFIAVVEAQGFAAAARKQGVSTAAISRQVTHLEAELKTRLLNRTTRHIALTEIGSQYYQLVKQTMSQLEEAEAAISSSQDEATGVLRVSSGYYTVQLLLARLPEFMALNPKLQIKFELSEGRLTDLSQEPVDIIFGSTLEGSPDSVRRRVGSTQFVLCASPAYLAEFGTPKTPLDLKEHRYIAHSGRHPDNQITFANHPPVFVDPVLWLNDSRSMQDCARSGIGIVKLHHYIVAQTIKDGLLVPILTEFNEPEKPIYLYYQETRYLQPKIRRFIDFYADDSRNALS